MKKIFTLLALLVTFVGVNGAWAETYTGTVAFNAQNRITNNNDGTFTTANNAGNQYALALADLSSLENITGASSVTLDFDVTVSGRLLIGIGDKNTRGTTANSSSKSTYNTDGLIMYYGTSDGKYVRVNGGTNNSDAMGVTTHVSFTLDLVNKTYSYNITNSEGTPLFSANNVSTSVPAATVVEAYSWNNNQTITISDISYSYEYSAGSFTYTVNAVDADNNVIKEIASGTATEPTTVYYPYAIESDGKYYTTAETSFGTDVSSINNTVNVLYILNEQMVNFIEAESANTNTSGDASYSGGATGYIGAGKGYDLGTLPAGVYTLYAFLEDRGDRGIYLRSGGAKGTEVINLGTDRYSAKGLYNGEFTLAQSTALYVGGFTTNTGNTNQSANLDYIYVLKTGDLPSSETISIPEGKGTYVSNYNLDFTDNSIKAYIATEQSGSSVTFTPITIVPAKTPILVKGSTGTVNISTDATTAIDETNLLIAGTGAAVESEADGKYNFILNKIGEEVGFYRAAGNTVAEDRAYLSLDSDIPTGSAKVNLIFSDEESTGINNVNAVENTNEKIFNLAGQQMKSTVKGVYIKNGKKYVK